MRLLTSIGPGSEAAYASIGPGSEAAYASIGPGSETACQYRTWE